MRTDLPVSCTISRPSGGPLELQAPGTYEVVGLGPGGRSWRRHTVEGRYQHGRALLGAVLDTMTVALVVRVYGASQSQISTRAQTLITAVSQMSYTVSVTLGGTGSVNYQWKCEPADVQIAGGEFDKYHLMAGHQDYVLSIPRDPNPVAGSI